MEKHAIETARQYLREFFDCDDEGAIEALASLLMEARTSAPPPSPSATREGDDISLTINANKTPTLSMLEAALKTFPTGRIFLRQWDEAEAALAREKARADELEAACAAMRERLEVRSVGALSTDDGPRWECDLCEATGTIDAVNARGEFSQPDVVHAPGCELASDAGLAFLAERDRLRAVVEAFALAELDDRIGEPKVDMPDGTRQYAIVLARSLAAGIDDAKGG